MSWKMETGKSKLEIRNSKLETRKPRAIACQHFRRPNFPKAITPSPITNHQSQITNHKSLNFFSPSVLNLEAAVFFAHRFFRFFDAGHARAARTLGQMALEFFECPLIPNSVDFHASAGKILNESPDAKLEGDALGEKTETNALNPSRYHVRSGNVHRCRPGVIHRLHRLRRERKGKSAEVKSGSLRHHCVWRSSGFYPCVSLSLHLCNLRILL